MYPWSSVPKTFATCPATSARPTSRKDGYGAHDIEILAEINHAPRLSLAELIAQAEQFSREGADVIDLGCVPGSAWPGIGDAVTGTSRPRAPRVGRQLRPGRSRVGPSRPEPNWSSASTRSNRDRAADWGVEVVAIPDHPGSLEGLEETIERLAVDKVPFRIDPILEPIGFGFAASLGRYLEVRRRFPQTPMMMGVGNLTELTDVDSAGVNTLLIGFCQELGIRSVLTTAVINWARSSVREIDLARRLDASCGDPQDTAQAPRTAPRHASRSQGRVVRRGEPRRASAEDSRPELEDLRRRGPDLRDQQHELPLRLRSLQALRRMGTVDPSHAFYLGYEMMKAKTALTLGKAYRQDQALEWGFLTEPEESHLARRGRPASAQPQDPTRTRSSPRTRKPEAARTTRTRTARDSRRDRDHREPRRCSEHRTDGPGNRPGPEPAAVRASPVSIVHDLPEPQGTGRGGLSRDRRRAAAGPGRDRRTDRAGAGAAARPGPSPAGFSAGPVDTTNSGRSTSMTVPTGPESRSRRVADGRIRDFLGFNRARHAVVEAAILATRTRILPRAEILADLGRLAVLVAKTGGPVEEKAFRLLHEYVLSAPEATAPNLAATPS